jgi:glycosyltransferase involved in cell wall biosynthesis
VLTYPPPPPILPPRSTGPRPFWSVMIPVYNRVTYLERTLRSVLSQDPGAKEMQIAVVDDASSLGDPEALVRRVGGERVDFVRQPRRLGGIANWNSCIERSLGEWVHILHSDDVVFSGFYGRLKAALERRDDVGAAFCRCGTIDENEAWRGTSELERLTPGVLAGFIYKIGAGCRIQCASIVVRRSVYERLGGFRTDLSYAADWEMWVRIAARCPIWYEPATLAAWRVHSGSWTALIARSAEGVVDERRCIAVIRPLLPSDQAESISRTARENVACRALSNAYHALGKGEFTTALRRAWEGLNCSASPRVVIRAILLLPVRVARDVMRRAFTAGKRQLTRGRG